MSFIARENFSSGQVDMSTPGMYVRSLSIP
jgi:hypothetical protein